MSHLQLNEKARARFEKKIRKEDGHWFWISAKTPKGYGVFTVTGNRQLYAHRLSYAIHKGEIPEKMNVRATCGHRDCICPDHLELETNRERFDRMTSSGVLWGQK